MKLAHPVKVQILAGVNAGVGIEPALRLLLVGNHVSRAVREDVHRPLRGVDYHLLGGGCHQQSRPVGAGHRNTVEDEGHLLLIRGVHHDLAAVQRAFQDISSRTADGQKTPLGRGTLPADGDCVAQGDSGLGCDRIMTDYRRFSHHDRGRGFGLGGRVGIPRNGLGYAAVGGFGIAWMLFAVLAGGHGRGQNHRQSQEQGSPFHVSHRRTSFA